MISQILIWRTKYEECFIQNKCERKTSLVNMCNCKYISMTVSGIVLAFIDGTMHLIATSEYIEKSGVDSKEILEAIVDKLWGSTDDTVVDIDEIIETLQKKPKSEKE